MELTWDDLADGCCGHGQEIHDEHAGITRRSVLAAAGIAPLIVGAVPGIAQAGTVTPSGVQRSALHVHSSFSEGSGGLVAYGDPNKTQASMQSHADSLDRLGYDLVMFTDHDHRMAGENPGVTHPRYPSGENFLKTGWAYTTQKIGADGGVTFGSTGMRVSVTTGSTPGTVLSYADCGVTTWNYRSTLAGTMMTVKLVAPETGWAEFRLLSSHRPAMNGRPEGGYELRYQFNPTARMRDYDIDGTIVTVTIPVAPGKATTVTVNPTGDFAQAFPDLGGLVQDFGAYGFWFGVGGPARTIATATFIELSIDRGADLDDAILIQRDLLDELGPMYPGIRLAQGLEMSYGTHLNWLATDGVRGFKPSGQAMGDYLRSCVKVVAAAGGAASYNHLFGAIRGPLLSATDRQAKIDKMARQLLATGAYGAHVLEVGYNIRGGVDLAGHMEVWDVMLAAGYRIYAGGVSDNHNGTFKSYAGDSNCFATDIIAPSSDPRVAVPALRAGRAYVSMVGRYAGMLDLATDGAVMGGATTVTGSAASIAVTATGLNGKTVKLVQYAVHGNKTVTRRAAPVFTKTVTGSTVVDVLARTSYVRAEVWDAKQCVAFSNPIFLTAG